MKRIPTATYRVQFHAGFTFHQATKIIPYLDELGVSDLYASPYFQASPESTHGYDVANHNRLNAAVGDAAALRRLVSELRSHDMGQVLDFVPNHMGVAQSLNTWWMSVLEEGPASHYASYFDIDWTPGRRELHDRVLLPVLGDLYGKVLEKGDIQIVCENGAFFAKYYETKLPVNPSSYVDILDRAADFVSHPWTERLRTVADRFTDGTPLATAKEELARCLQDNAALRSAVDQSLAVINGRAGVASSFDALHEILESQYYRLSYWRVAAEEINYRRFFDINTLAAIRVEVPEVFEASHQFVFELLARGDVTGLRIDHIDGLWDPKRYLEKLQERFGELSGGKTLFLVVEKILDPLRERLPEGWPVDGTTGYEFANQVAHVLLNSAAERRFTTLYQRFSGVTDAFSDLVYEKKLLTMQRSLSSEVASLGRMLDRLSEMHRNYRDFTRNTLTNAVREVIACFPVYRTYVGENGIASPEDERVVLRAISAARRRNPTIEKPVFDFVRAVLLLRLPEHLTGAQRDAHLQFVLKFQQCSGPVMAKGLEDTALYIYGRFIALNEVGGNPGQFGISVDDFHQLNKGRSENHPVTLLATSTHDTKRSEDVRARLLALSEFAPEWRQAVSRWSRMNSRWRATVDGELAPSRNEEYFLYQTLVGSWPLEAEGWTDYRSRIDSYMLKVLKEAKVNSSWTEPNEPWEDAVKTFVAAVLDTDNSSEFIEDCNTFCEQLGPVGAMNSLVQLILKSTVPGIPDFYQGSELWDLSLVDPDNRRPVDYTKRVELSTSLRGASPQELLADWKSGAVKLWLTRKLLRLRRENPDFFANADYVPLVCTGTAGNHVIAFQREWRGKILLVAVPRLARHLTSSALQATGEWDGTELSVSSAVTDALTGQDVPCGTVGVGQLLKHFPGFVGFSS